MGYKCGERNVFLCVFSSTYGCCRWADNDIVDIETEYLLLLLFQKCFKKECPLKGAILVGVHRNNGKNTLKMHKTK